ncbi:tetratricopeptide repeat protein [Clostridium uliginosum]|uniref:Anaphase-promoting complex, cyclosome, subunit 3 n=1 Tax=Clostridium uliginosum TaxID=119641 RepID=A0A1I1K0Q9_9CLOT|nr:tetratricopeptide repeat protein [Clostridium uliginosum]SFC51210.1 Anaphase-promoting complex, cyclosome, subunit 3 [Clostridium uliginosum]
MEKDEKIQDKINNFLKENKINITGGIISSEEELSSVLNNIAIDDLEKGKVDKALYFVNKAMEFNSKNYYSLFVKGLIYRDIKKYNEAIETFKEYNNHSNDKLSFIYIGFCYAELNDTENALNYFRKCEKEFSEEEKDEYSSLMCAVYECIGNIYMNKENILEFYEDDKFKLNYKLAIKYYKMSLRINKDNHMLLNKLAACYYHLEDGDKALYCYEEAARVAPENSAYLEGIEELKDMGAVSEPVEF